MKKLLSIFKKFPALKILVPVYVGMVVLFVVLIRQGHMQLLDPAGYIADIQSRILWGVIIFAAIAGSIVIGSFLFVVVRYREGTRKRYQPEWTASKKILLAGWGFSLVFIIALSTIVWSTAHQVDPYQPISSSTAPITIQVVALRWKWLFIYPKEQLATINTMQIPVNTPISLQLTADAPMNSFWVPRLSGQVYAMTGMVTQLHIEANKPGTYAGSSAELSGDDFAGMNFTVNAVSAHDYAVWKAADKKSARSLDYATYTQLAKPSSYNQPALYRLSDPNLFQAIVMQFMMPDSSSSMPSMGGMKM